MQRNELKNLIYIQENKPCNEQTVKGLFRSIVEPVLDNNSESLVLCRFREKSKNDFSGVLKRLEYSSAKVYDFSDLNISEKFENLQKEKIWDNTEFVYVLAERFGAVLIFDYEEGELENFAQYYTLFNSKKLLDSLDVISANSKKDLSSYYEKFRPDRRDNEILNNSIRKIVENLDETNQEMLISELAKEEIQDSSDLATRLEFLSKKTSYIAHEIRNHLSICNLYSTIIDKQSPYVSFANQKAQKSLVNARECIKKSLQMTSNLLLDLKAINKVNLQEVSLDEIVSGGLELARIYASGKDIQFVKNLDAKITVLIDEGKFLSVLINLIKNAVESIEKIGEIVIEAKIEDENVKITVSNTGNPIPKELQERIFEDGFTTKASGNGLGLIICKKTIEEQFGQLKLKKSDEKSTDFEVTVLKGEG